MFRQVQSEAKIVGGAGTGAAEIVGMAGAGETGRAGGAGGTARWAGGGVNAIGAGSGTGAEIGPVRARAP